MARKKFNQQNDFPGLFDDFNVTAPQESVPVHPDIARHVANAGIDAPIKPNKPSERLLFMSIGSGSSGNCAYIGDKEKGILIDAGVDMKQITDALKANDIPISAVKGICLTHDHGDHIKGAYKLMSKNRHIMLYCTPKTLSGIFRRHNVSRRIKDYHKPIYRETPFDLGGFKITAFEVSHDGTDNMGYFIERGSIRFAIATDLGYITDRVDHYMRQADYIMLESNYDRQMLAAGSYPEYLKARILANTGHLDNEDAAQFVADIYTPQLRHVFLCHLSNDNNTPEIAIEKMTTALQQAHNIKVGDGSESIDSRQSDIQITPLPRYEASRLFILRKD
jgi:phosphoribosyl 1,2-cyclic phosphodiesterase